MKRRPILSPTASTKRLRVAMNSPALQVFCRLKPATPAILISEGFCINTPSDSYSFSRIFPQTTSQSLIFATIGAPAARSFLESKCSLICLCGLAKSGKAYSLFGSRSEMGLLPRVVQELMGTSVASHLVLSCVAVGGTRAWDLGNKGEELRGTPATMPIKGIEDVFRCMDLIPPDRKRSTHLLLQLKTHGSIRTSVLCFLLTASPAPRPPQHPPSTPNCYSVVQSLVAALRSPPTGVAGLLGSLVNPILVLPTTSLVVVCTLDGSQALKSALHLRLLALVTQGDKLTVTQRRNSLSPEKRNRNGEEEEFFSDVLQRREATILSLESELSYYRSLASSHIDLERQTRQTVLSELSEALESMDRLYKQNKSLIVDTYEDILAEKQAVYQKRQAKAEPSTHSAETQCRAEVKDAWTGMEDKKKPGKKVRPVPVSPISSRTRGAGRRNPGK